VGRRGWSWRRASLLIATIAGLSLAGASSALAVTITEFSTGLKEPLQFGAITGAGDGNVWFTGAHSIGRIAPSGAITEFTSGLKSGSLPVAIAEGREGDLWFSDDGTTKAIGRITPAGAIVEFTTGLNPGSAPEGIVLGPDGNLWFIDPGTTNAIGRVTPSGAIKEFTLKPNSQPNDIAAGPDGNVWFTEKEAKAIGRITPSGGITEFGGPPLTNSSMPSELTAGADGDIWFTDEGSPSAVGRVTPSTGAIAEFHTGLQANAVPTSPTPGPDGNVWFTDQYFGQRAIGRVTPSGAITEFTQGLSESLPVDIATGEDGNLWVSQAMPGGIARVTPGGAITEFSAGLNPLSGADGDQIISGPDRNLWFSDLGEPAAIGKVDLELPSPVKPEVPHSLPIVTPLAPPQAATNSTKVVFGNQQITLTTPSPSICTAAAKDQALLQADDHEAPSSAHGHADQDAKRAVPRLLGRRRPDRGAR
jgi:streptogramin lyase